MVVNCGDIYIDLKTGRKVDGNGKAIPLSVNTVFRKIKPLMKYKKKIGQIWIATPRLSLEYLMAIYMVKNEKKKVAGFFRLDTEGKYAVMEFTYSPSPAGITTTFNIIEESPHLYMEIEDKSYDSIFGNTNVSNVSIDFDKLLKSLMFSLDTREITILIVGIVVILSSVYMAYKMLKPAKTTTIQKTATPPPLTEEEKNYLHQQVIKEMFEKYNKAVNSMNIDTAMSSATFRIENGEQSVKGILNIKYTSFYPYSGASVVQSEKGELYEWSDDIVIEKSKKDIKKITTDDPMICLKVVIGDDWAVISRKDRMWHIKMTTKDYGEFVKKINRIKNCDYTMKNINLSAQEYQCELILNAI